MAPQLPSLNGIRALCIISVVGSHATRSTGFPAGWVEPSRYLFNGTLGVTIFFVLSGFLISFLLARERASAGSVSLRDFYVRRAVRILPVYLAFILSLAVLDALTGLDIEACRYATALTFTKNFGCSGFIEGHLWSISVEEQFYLLWPLAFVFLSRKRSTALAVALIAMAMPLRIYFYKHDLFQLRMYSFMSNADALMIGSLLGVAMQQYPERMIAFLQRRATYRRALAALLIYAIWAAQTQLLIAFFTVPMAATLEALAAGYLIASFAFVKQGWTYRLLNLRGMNYIGLLSYSIYIWQQPFFDTENPYGYTVVPTILVFPYNILACLVVAGVSYHLLEMPLLALRRRFRPPDRAPQPKTNGVGAQIG